MNRWSPGAPPAPVLGWIGTLATLAATLLAAPAQAYVGPGAGLSALGALLALFLAFFAAVLGFFWFPIKLLLRRLRGTSAASNSPTSTEVDSPK